MKSLRSSAAKLPNAVKTLASKSLECYKSIANKAKDSYKVISSESRQACLNINRYLESLGDKTKRAAGFELELAGRPKFSDVKKKRPDSFEPVVFEEAEASVVRNLDRVKLANKEAKEILKSHGFEDTGKLTEDKHKTKIFYNR